VVTSVLLVLSENMGAIELANLQLELIIMLVDQIQNLVIVASA